MKDQLVRIADVLLIGPACVLAGVRLDPRTPFGAFMVITGVLTVVYNAENFRREEARKIDAQGDPP